MVHGTYVLEVPGSRREIPYGIALVTPENYPKELPEMFCNDPKLPIGNTDRHIAEDGKACLGVRAEIAMRWRSHPTILAFLESFVAPFLAWQFYYDVFKQPPPWGARPHGLEGIIEFYREILGMPSLSQDSVIGFMDLLARKNNPKGHEVCPCGSGKKLRHCHAQLVYTLRLRLPGTDVAQDMKAIFKIKEVRKKAVKASLPIR